mgnify:FL=1
MSSSSIRRGAVKTVEWWKHLRSRKRAQNKLVRKDGKERMKDDLKETREWAQELYEIAKAKGDKGDFAYELAALSFESHLAELSQIERKKANER